MTTSAALDELLSSLQSHLSTQTSHLPHLHEQLGLPASALETELDTLQEKLIATVEDQVALRKKEVADWIDKCETAEAQWSQYVTHLGGFVKERDKQGTSIEEIKQEQVLPRRFELGRKAGERVKQLYQAKIDTLNGLNGRMRSLANVLGATFFPLEILHAKDDDDFVEVTPERFARIEKELARGKAEVTNRLHALANAFCQIEWLYSELGLSPADDSVSTPREMSPDSDPFLVSTPTPASRSSNSLVLPDLSSTSTETHHRRVLVAFIDFLDANPEAPDSDHIRFLSSLSPPVEPTVDFLQWADGLVSSLTEEKERREARIQTLYDQLEPIWVRLGITAEDIDAFVDHHRGTSLQTMSAYEEELDRMIELKRERMVEFVGAAREEVERLHEELLDSSSDDPYSYSENDEEVLALLEERIVQLKTELREKTAGGILGMVKKYFAICEEEKELAISAQDQSRLLGRGRDAGRLLREEKMRKRVKKEKPRIQQDLLTALPAWEEEYNRPFLVRGEPMLEILSAAQEVEEAEVGTKRKAPPGGSRAVTPGPAPGTSRGVTPTPATNRPRGMTPSSSRPGITTPSVRSASSATNANATGTKRMKLMDYATTSTYSSQSKGAPLSNASNRTQHIPSSSSKSGFGFHTVHAQQQARTVSIPVPKPGTAHHMLGHGRLPTAAAMAYPSRNFSSSTSITSTGRQVSYQQERKRESFRPRPSIDSLGMSTTSTAMVGGPRSDVGEAAFSRFVGVDEEY